MNRKKTGRILAALLMVLYLCGQGICAQASEEEDVVLPIYPLIVMNRETEDGFVCQSFVVKDGDSQWMISTEVLELFPTDEYVYSALVDGSLVDVEPAWTGDHVTILYSPEKIDVPAFWLADEIDPAHEHAYIGVDNVDTDTLAVTYDADTMYIDEVRKIGKFYCIVEEEGLDDIWFGVPVLDAETIEAVGVLGIRGEDSGFYDITGISLPQELSMENWGEEEIPEVRETAEETAEDDGQGTDSQTAEDSGQMTESQTTEEGSQTTEGDSQTTDSQPTEDEPQSADSQTAGGGSQTPDSQAAADQSPVTEPAAESAAAEKDETNWAVYLPVAAGIMAAITAPLSKKAAKSRGLKKEQEGKTQPVEEKLNSVENGSISLETLEIPGADCEATIKQEPVVQNSGNIIKGLSGHLAGVRMPIGKGLTAGRDSGSCELCFPVDAKGISSHHFSVSEDGDDIILRDLGSSYGTFFENGERLMSDTAYRITSGTVFYLAHGDDSFWIGKEEDEMNTHYQFAVKALAGELKDRTYYMARGGRMYFGRGEGCQVQFSSVSKGVSGNHCEIRWLDGKVVLVDNGSTNGTFWVNGMRLKPGTAYELEQGMQFYLTDERNTFQVTECR